MIHIYTGDGKGKTTAALGLAVRAAGHGKRVKIIQFMKGCPEYGELETIKKIQSISIEQFGRREMVDRCSPSDEDRRLAGSALNAAIESIRTRACDVLVLDEINVALDYDLIDLDKVLEILRTRPEEMEIVLTGRSAPGELVETADYVTEMKEIKHPYRKGVEGREGIEY